MLWMIVQSILNGLLNGGVYAVVAVGLTIVFGVMNMINFASGEFVMLGMYLTYLLYSVTGWSCYALIPGVVVLMSLIGFASYKLVIQPVLGRSEMTYVIVTIGLSYFLMNLAQMIFTATPKNVPSSIKTASLNIGSFTLSLPRVIAFVSAFVLIAGIHLFLQNTMTGRAMRATSEKPEVAQMLGVNTKFTFTFAFVLSCVLAAVAGLLITPVYSIYPTAGNIFKITSFMIVVLGGMGSIPGALVGGLLCGAVEALVGTVIDTNLGPAGIFVVFLLVVYLRPQGIFGKGARVA